MSIPLSQVLLLDTNIVVHAVRQDALWEEVKRQFDPMIRLPKPLVSHVSYGELWSLAELNGWREQKLSQLNFLLAYFTKATCETDEIIAAYALIDVYSRGVGVPMGKNDLWIAATARVNSAILVTTDRDFDHLDGKFLTRLYITPGTGL